MLLNMDAEIQHLISVSMDKMTSGTNPSLAGRGSRKSRGMDLRKALLVAHFLQEVRCAYFDEDYDIMVNTVKGVQTSNCDSNEEEEEINSTKEYDRCKEESRTYFMETDSNASDLSSSSMFQSCVTNSDMMVSRISQVTQPLAISVNTSYVMSHHGFQDEAEEKEEANGGVEVPAFCEELEVSSTCEEATSICDDDQSCQDVTSSKLRDSNSNSSVLIGCELNAEAAAAIAADSAQCRKTRDVINEKSDVAAKTAAAAEHRSTNCPLPKKKRPLPKEFLENNNSPSPVAKSPKTNDDSAFESSKVVSNPFPLNSLSNERTLESGSISTTSCSISTSIANTVTQQLESKTSTSLSTVCSVMGSAPLLMAQKPGRLHSNPKVVVQITQSCDSYMPITCSQICLERRLSEMTARTF